MNRILLSLASLSLVLMGTTLVLGLTMGDLYNQPGLQTLHWATVHRLTGVAAALAVVFVESVIVTYFIGTSRWCREVVETYQLDPNLVREANRLKRRTFPWAMAGMLAVVGIVALGGASDPATGRANTEQWVNLHLTAALAGIMFVATTYVAAWNNITANQTIISQIEAEVRRIREERGLDRPQPAPRPSQPASPT